MRKGRWSAREIARRALRRVESQAAYASLAIDAELSQAPSDDRRERALATEIVYGTLRHRTRLDRALGAHSARGIRKLAPQMRTILRVGAYQLLFLDRVPDHAAVDDAVRAARKLGGNRMAGFVNAILRSLATGGEPSLPAVPEQSGELAEYVELVYSLPSWIVSRLEQVVGQGELLAAAAAFAQPARLAIRVNTTRATVAQVAEVLRSDHEGVDVETVDAAPEALLCSGLGAPEGSPSFAEGLWTVQDVGAQRVSLLARPVAGQRVLDACAGLGGKTTHLAQLAGDQASILAVDVSARKLEQTLGTAKRLGLTSIETRVVDLLDGEPNGLQGPFDVVVLDAPCSGLGVLRRHPEAKWRAQETLIGNMAELQRRMLDALAPVVADGGALIYSVCTFTREEGAEQVASFLERYPEFTLEGDELQLFPHRDEADGFYGARLVRRTVL